MKPYYAAVALALSIAVPGTVWANECPTLMARIDNLLAADPALPEDTLTEVRALRIDGEQLHAEGDHEGSVDALQQALELLGAS